jgi:hypothetical protein
MNSSTISKAVSVRDTASGLSLGRVYYNTPTHDAGAPRYESPGVGLTLRGCRREAGR